MRSSGTDFHTPTRDSLLRDRDREAGAGGGIEMPRQAWINEITVTADAGNPGEEEPPEHLPSHRGSSNTADMVTWRVYADGVELHADRRVQGKSRSQRQEQGRVGQGLPRTPDARAKHAETRGLEPRMRCP